jgi:uncharacterized membrane protein YfbV (UPF0208 family)
MMKYIRLVSVYKEINLPVSVVVTSAVVVEASSAVLIALAGAVIAGRHSCTPVNGSPFAKPNTELVVGCVSMAL